MLAARSGMRVPMADGRGRGEAVGGATQRGVKIRQLIRSENSAADPICGARID